MALGLGFSLVKDPAGDGDFIGVVSEPTSMEVDEETAMVFRGLGLGVIVPPK